MQIACWQGHQLFASLSSFYKNKPKKDQLWPSIILHPELKKKPESLADSFFFEALNSRNYIYIYGMVGDIRRGTCCISYANPEFRPRYRAHPPYSAMCTPAPWIERHHEVIEDIHGFILLLNHDISYIYIYIWKIWLRGAIEVIILFYLLDMPPPKSHQPLTEIQDPGGRGRPS